jgi:hypothetical protein
VSLARHGVLFLDELLEIPRHVLDALRQPLEDGRVVIARAATSVTFPAQFTLVGAMNPCPCGRAGDPRGGCSRAASEIAHRQSRLSGPLADRIDMQVRLAAVPLRELGKREGGESSAAVRRARTIASSTSRGPSRTSMTRRPSPGRTSPKRCGTGRWKRGRPRRFPRAAARLTRPQKILRAAASSRRDRERLARRNRPKPNHRLKPLRRSPCRTR